MTLPNAIVAAYSFDVADQLTSLAYTRLGAPVGDLTYSYENAGNRVGIGGTLATVALPAALGSAVYDVANELTQRESQSLTYDANGNLTSDGLNTYSWNARNELATIASANVAAFQYDAFGRRAEKTLAGATRSSQRRRTRRPERAGGNPYTYEPFGASAASGAPSCLRSCKV